MSELERLRELLLSDEQALLDEHKRRFRDLPRDLPHLIHEAQALDSGRRLATALAEPVGQALEDAVKRNRRAVVDAIFPVIGPAIRKAIVVTLRALMDDLGRVLESALTIRGLRWRIEAWRAGVPYSEVVLKHTLRFKLDHLFLIDRSSGLVLRRESAPDLPDLDADAVAGMLTAIGDFVRESVSRSGDGALSSANVGEHVLWVFEGPRANLACFIRGIPPDALRIRLETLLEEVHASFDESVNPENATRQGDLLDVNFDLPQLEASVHQGETIRRTVPKIQRWPLWLAFAVIVVLAAAWPVRSWLWERRLREVEALLQTWPGFVLEGLHSRPYRSVTLRGLFDPLADPPQASLARSLLRGITLETNFRGYLSTDPEIIVRRAMRTLAPPASVSIRATNGVLVLRGTAPRPWIASVRSRALTVPGVTVVDADALTPDQSDLARAALKRLAERVAAHQIELASGRVVPHTEDERAAVSALFDMLNEAKTTADSAHARVRVLCFGLTDKPGSDPINTALREDRATWLASEIKKRIPGLDVEIASTETMASESRQSNKRAMLAKLLVEPISQ